MPKTPETTNPTDWHRYFAMTANNSGWRLAEQTTRTTAEDEEMLNVAHAAAYHWDTIGTELNHMRAKMLLAQVHALLGMGESAFAYAEAIQRYFLKRDETPDWEIAFVHTIHAHAAHVAGKMDLHRESYAEATHALDAIAEEKEREIVLRTFATVPKP